MYFLIFILPFIGFLYSGLFGRYFGKELSCFFSTLTIFLSFLISLYIFYEVVLSHSAVNLQFFNWIVFDIITVNFGLFFDNLTSMMLIIITGISLLVHIYSYEYMSNDPCIIRFFSYLSLFTFFMIFLVTADNYVQLFIGWEGVGLCSYLLINFWHTRVLANKAALKAMIMNRVADVFFLFGIVYVLLMFKTTEFLIVFPLVSYFINENFIYLGFTVSKITLISFFFFIGAVGKSAQLGLHTWLPDAMEGPTPVSSLLHAATMVTAGVYLLIRSSFFIERSPLVLCLIAIIGGLTAFFFAIVGVFQYDVKKIIAYSTCSQLGYMFFSCGLSNYQAAFFHLFNHAFFKALLFLSAGSLIHALSDEQDMRRMGGLLNFLPFTYICFLIGSLAIMGFPFLTGFYSKDLVIELAYSRYVIDAEFIYFLGTSTAFFTAVYSARLLLFVFFFEPNFFKSYLSMHESNSFMYFSMLVLSIASIFVGYLCSDLMAGLGSDFFDNSIFVLPSNFNYIDPEFLHPILKNGPLICTASGFHVGMLFCEWFYHEPMNENILKIWKKISKFMFNAGYFNTLYNDIFLKIFKISYSTTNKHIDKGFLEFFGPFGLYKFFRTSYFKLRYMPAPVIFLYIGYMFISIIVFLLFLVLHVKLIIFLSYNMGILCISLIILILDSFFGNK